MEHESDKRCYSLDPLVLSLIISLCLGSLKKFYLQHVKNRRLCIVPETVVLVILVDLLILASILSGILFGCAGWCGFVLFCFYASDLDCVWGLCFHLEAPVLTCFLLYLFCCYYISKLVRLSNCSASSLPLWLVL